MNWQDLRVFCSAAQAPTLSASAKRLGTSIATVGRRLTALEHELGFRLFDRAPDGITLTTQGRALFERANTAAAAMEDVSRLAASLQTSGWPDPVRISATEPIISDILAPALPDLLAKAPDIRIDLLSTNNVISLSAREADIAVRFARPAGDSLIVRTLPPIELGLFASKSYLAGRRPAGLQLQRERLLGFDPSYGRIAEVVWLEKTGLSLAVVARSSSTRAMLNAASAGAGIAILARMLARPNPNLVEIPTALAIPKRPVWLLMHRDLRRAGPLRVAREWIVDAFRRSASGRGHA